MRPTARKGGFFLFLQTLSHPGSPIKAAVRHTRTVRPPRPLRYTPSYSRRLYSGPPSVRPTVRPAHRPSKPLAACAIRRSVRTVCSFSHRSAVRPARRPSTPPSVPTTRRLRYTPYGMVDVRVSASAERAQSFLSSIVSVAFVQSSPPAGRMRWAAVRQTVTPRYPRRLRYTPVGVVAVGVPPSSERAIVGASNCHIVGARHRRSAARSSVEV